MRRHVFLITIALGVVACGGKSAPAGETTPAAPRRLTNVVTADEIAAHGGTNLYDVLRALRPAWFRIQPTHMSGGTVSGDPVSLYVDGRRMGTASLLIDIPLNVVSVVKFYSPSEAQGRFGLNNLSGAIEVTTNSRY